MGAEPSPMGNPPDCTMTTVVPCRKFTLHRNGDRSLSLNGYSIHFRDRAPPLNRDSLYVNEPLL